MRRNPVWLVAWIAVSCALSVPGWSQQKAAAGATVFDIPAGAADRALKQFAAQSGREVAFGTATTATVTTNAVKGSFTPREAMDLMLAGTGLVAETDPRSGAMTISRDPNGRRVAQARPGERRPSENNPTAAGSGTEGTLTLSPFEVHAERDTGYAASGTLMGTRLNTELKDVAASVSAITKDFMIDVNANDLERLLVYTLGTEVAGMGGNFSNASDSGGRYTDSDGPNRGETPATRIRGLGSADNTRDFFLSSIPTDGYNIDRVEISRGPNAMLFGLGAPAGIINAGLKKAETRRNQTEFTQQIGSWGTFRTQFDHNQVLVRDKLALRVDGVNSSRKYKINHAYNDDRRIFLAATYRPLRGMTVKGNYEYASLDSNKPKDSPPLDTYSHWWDTGMPVYDPTTGLVTLLGTPREGYPSARAANGGINATAINATQFGDVGWRAAIIYSNPSSSVPGIPTVPGAAAMKTRADRARINPANGQLVEAAMATMQAGVAYERNRRPASDFTRGFYRWNRISDPRIFNFYEEQLDGPNNDGYQKWDAFNVAIEQRALNDQLGIEVAIDYQDQEYMILDSSGGGEYSLYLDINTHLLNGQPNPNLGRPVHSSTGGQTIRNTERRAGRATAYYNIDLRKFGPENIGKALGRHTVTLSHTDQENYLFARSGTPIVVGPDYEMYEYNAIAAKTSASRRLARIEYLGPSVIGTSTPFERPIQAPSVRTWPETRTLSMLASVPPPTNATALNPWEVRPFSIATNDREEIRTVNQASKRRDKFKSSVAVLTNRWFEGRAISFLSWRRDDYESFDAGGAPLDTSTGTLLLGPEVYRLAPVNSGGASKFTYGITVHAPDFVKRRLPLGADFSLYYNRSDNFRPQAQRFNVFDQPIGSERGETKEYGLRLSLFHGKFEMRVTNYKTAAALATETGLGNGINAIPNRVEAAIEQLSDPGGFYQTQAVTDPAYRQGIDAFNAWLQTPGAQQIQQTWRFVTVTNSNGSKQITTSLRSGEVVATTDFVSEGWEIEAIFNPTRSWRISFNGAQQEAVKSNAVRDLRKLVDEVWTPLVTSPFGAMRSTTNALTFMDESQGTVYQPLSRIELLQGSRSQELREWNWRGVTNYSFREGRLRGFSIGGAVRWAQGGAIGYPVINVPEAGGAVIDVRNPHFSPAQTTFDGFVAYSRRLGPRVQWTARFHLRNIGVGNELIPIQANPDGSISGYKIREPQAWTVSNSFSF